MKITISGSTDSAVIEDTPANIRIGIPGVQGPPGALTLNNGVYDFADISGSPGTGSIKVLEVISSTLRRPDASVLLDEVNSQFYDELSVLAGTISSTTRTWNDEFGIKAFGFGGSDLRYTFDPNGDASIGYGAPRRLYRRADLGSTPSAAWGNSQLLGLDGSTVRLSWENGLGFFGAAEIAQPDVFIIAATHTVGIGTPITEDSTFDGYTVGQIVAALRASIGLGLLQ